MKSAVTLSLVPEARGGPFVFWDGLEDGFTRAAALGFDAVEIFPPSAEAIDVAALGALCARHRLKIAAFGTGGGWVRQQLHLVHPDAEHRRQARNFIAGIVDAGARLGAPAIIGSMQGRWGGTVAREQALAWLAEGLDELAPRAAAHGLPLFYEVLNRYESNLLNRVADALDFLKSVRAPNVKLLCDLYHMNIEEADLPAALRLAGPRLGHVHFVDSNRRAIGFGHTAVPPLVTALREIGYTGYLSAEVTPLPDSQAAAARTIQAFRQFVG
jgi:sugar phosphate isomerase/epimerase